MSKKADQFLEFIEWMHSMPEGTPDYIFKLELKSHFELRSKYSRVKEQRDSLLDALEDAAAHLDYTGYGDSWERECADASNLPDKIRAALAKCNSSNLVKQDSI